MERRGAITKKFSLQKLVEDIEKRNVTEELTDYVRNTLQNNADAVLPQINQHFLYNALNTISAYTLDNPDITRELIGKLSIYLRRCLDFGNREKPVSLKKELELVEAYLFIEQARFGDRLQVEYNIDESIGCVVSQLSFLEMVENAVSQLEKAKGGGTLKISIFRKECQIIFRLESMGNKISETQIGRILEEV